MGPPGVGKTYMCAALMEVAFNLYPTVRFHKEGDLFSKLRSQMETSDYIEVLKSLADDHLVIIDDLGVSLPSTNSNWRSEVIFTLIDIRYNLKLPTIYTTNLKKLEIERIYGERTASRLFCEENVIIDLFGEPDLRKMGY
jgi:DNA replication protein DnaC